MNEAFPDFIHDIPLWSGNCDCSHRRRIDFRKLVGNTLLCIEVDEHQHKRYNKKDEEIRYDDLFMIHGGKLETKKNPYMKRRMEYLEKEINNQVDRINKEKNNELLEMVYLFYDGFDYNFN